MATVQGTAQKDFIHIAGDGHSAPSGYNDEPNATNGDDTISAGDGNDIIYAGDGNDTIDGGNGSDTFYFSANQLTAGDILTGGSGVGTDVLTFTTGVSIGDNEFSHVSHIEVINLADASNYVHIPEWLRGSSDTNRLIVNGGSGADNISASDISTGTSTVALYGGSGDDSLTGSNSGGDILDGGAGIDQLGGGLGNDTYYVDNRSDVIWLETGSTWGFDTVYASSDYALPNGQYLEVLSTIDPNATTPINLWSNDLGSHLIGNAGKNTLTGGDAADVLDGGRGADTMIGNGGDDTFYVDNSGDKVIEAPRGGNDTVLTTINYTLPSDQEVENLATSNDAGTAAFHLTGSVLNNAIRGNAGPNVIDGAGGNDTLSGLGGSDTFIFTPKSLDANDTVDGGTGTGSDRLTFTTAGTIPPGAFANVSHIETIVLGTGGDNSLTLTDALVGSSDSNHILTVSGSAGNDTIDGSAVTTVANRVYIYAGTGNDTLTGGAGADIFYFATAALNASDTVNGGTGTSIDSLDIFTGGTVAAAAWAGVSHIEKIILAPGFTHAINLSDALVGSADDNHVLTVLGGASRDGINAAAVTTATNSVRFEGLGGGDRFVFGAGADTAIYTGVADSTGNAAGNAFDSFGSFNAAVDRIDLPNADKPTSVASPFTDGTWNNANDFDQNMSAIVGPSLSAHTAVVFHETTGTFAGHDFLVVNPTGNTGYVSGADYVFDVTGHTGAFATSTFI